LSSFCGILLTNKQTNTDGNITFSTEGRTPTGCGVRSQVSVISGEFDRLGYRICGIYRGILARVTTRKRGLCCRPVSVRPSVRPCIHHHHLLLRQLAATQITLSTVDLCSKLYLYTTGLHT